MTTADGDLFLGVDAGTSGCKAVVLTAGGTVAGEGWAGYESTAGPDGAITQSADDWVTAMERATLQALSDLDGRRVVAMSLTAPAYNCVLLGADDRPTGDVVLWSDPRPGIDAAALRASHGDLIRERALVELGPSHTASQLRWLLRSEPNRMAATRSLLIGKDYLRFVLTGVRAIDPSNAASTALFDVRSGEWMAMLCADIGIDPSWLPGVVSSLDDGAALTEHWGQRLGLRAGCPVVAGANDTSDELVSVGATAPGSGVVKIATTGTVVVVDAVPHSAPGLLTYPHAEPGMWYMLAATNTAGGALAWLCTNVLGGTGDADDIRRIEQSAGGVAAGADGLTAFPWFAGERAAVQRADVRAAFLGAGIEHTSAHFGRAVMERRPLRWPIAGTPWRARASSWSDRCSPAAACAANCGSRSWWPCSTRSRWW